MLAGLVEVLQREAKEAYPLIHGTLVATADQFVPNRDVLNGLSECGNQEEEYDEGLSRFKSADHKEVMKGVQSPRKDKNGSTYLRPQEVSQDQSRKYVRPGSSSSDMYSGISKYSRIKDDNSVN